MDLVDYPQSTCLTAGAATPLHLGAESGDAFSRPSHKSSQVRCLLWCVWTCLSACYGNIQFALSDLTKPLVGAVPACLIV